MAMSNLSPDIFYHRNLPHIQPPGAELFVTFRLAGSIPLAILQALREEAERVQAELDHMPDSPERSEFIYREQRRLFGKWDEALDACTGPDHLRNPAVSEMIVENMRRYHGQRYELLAYCIMPNHVHVVLRPLPKTEGKDDYCSLSRIMHTMKGYTAGRANRLLGRTGEFWQHESYDHYARDSAELERIIAYVIGNPVKAKMVEAWEEWPWTYVTPQSLSG